jgi:hypothetical protein
MELVIELFDSKDGDWFEDLKRLVDEAGISDLSLVKIQSPGALGADERPRFKVRWTDPRTIAALLGVVTTLFNGDIEIKYDNGGVDIRIQHHESRPSIERKVHKIPPIRELQERAELGIRKSRAIPAKVPRDADPQSSEGNAADC